MTRCPGLTSIQYNTSTQVNTVSTGCQESWLATSFVVIVVVELLPFFLSLDQRQTPPLRRTRTRFYLFRSEHSFIAFSLDFDLLGLDLPPTLSLVGPLKSSPNLKTGPPNPGSMVGSRGDRPLHPIPVRPSIFPEQKLGPHC